MIADCSQRQVLSSRGLFSSLQTTAFLRFHPLDVALDTLNVGTLYVLTGSTPPFTSPCGASLPGIYRVVGY